MYADSLFKVDGKPVIIISEMIRVKVGVSKMILATILAVLTGCLLSTAQEKVCSNFCSSLGMMESNPGKSCDDIYQVNKASRGVSDDYWIQTATGTHQVYCDMELECGGHKGGWMRVVDLDISGGDSCPAPWDQVTVNTISMCQPPSNTPGCYGTTFTVYGVQYSKVCGKARGYQKGEPGAFSGGRSIDNGYVDGLAITEGTPRQHVWSYAVGHDDHRNSPSRNCPCASFPGPSPNSFVGNDYYCESGDNVRSGGDPNMYFTDDPLWDGDGCVSTNNNCCAAVGMPWFFRQFPAAQTGDLEARLCQDEGFNNEGATLDMLQLFVQ